MTALEEYRKAQHVWENISLLDRDTAIDEARTVNRAAMDAIAELEAELAALKAHVADEAEREALSIELFDKLKAELAALRAALQEIARGEGPFSRDPLTHAANTIEAMRECALSALGAARESTP
jgi:hypothetical protein